MGQGLAVYRDGQEVAFSHWASRSSFPRSRGEPTNRAVRVHLSRAPTLRRSSDRPANTAGGDAGRFGWM